MSGGVKSQNGSIRFYSLNPGFLLIGCCLVVSVCLGGCGGFRVPERSPAKADTVSLDPKAWYIDCSQGMPLHPSSSTNGAWSIGLPNSAGSVHYVLTPFRATVKHNLLRITFRVDASNDACYNGRVHPDAWDPATVHLFIERRGDDLRKEYYRWWATEGVYVLGSKDNSEFTIEVPLSPENWTSVNGNHNADEFNATLSDMGYVGITFGGSNYFASGVNMCSGHSTFTLVDFQVR